MIYYSWISSYSHWRNDIRLSYQVLSAEISSIRISETSFYDLTNYRTHSDIFSSYLSSSSRCRVSIYWAVSNGKVSERSLYIQTLKYSSN